MVTPVVRPALVTLMPGRGASNCGVYFLMLSILPSTTCAGLVTTAIAASITLRGCVPGAGNRMGSNELSVAIVSAALAENGWVKGVPTGNRFTFASTWLLLSTNSGPLLSPPRLTKQPSVPTKLPPSGPISTPPGTGRRRAWCWPGLPIKAATVFRAGPRSNAT